MASDRERDEADRWLGYGKLYCSPG